MITVPWATSQRLPGAIVLALWALILASNTRLRAAELRSDTGPLNAAALFKLTNVWTAHFTFTPEQWRAMEPKEQPGGFFGGPRGGRGGPGPRGGFGPGMILAPAFVREGDTDHDGKLSQAEFQSLASKWFDAWDKDHDGKLDAEQLRDGLSTSLAAAGFGGGPGPGGGRGGRGPGMNLQGAEGKRNGLASAAGLEFNYVHADLEFAGQRLPEVAVRYKGNGTFMQSRDSLKRSLKVELGKYVKGRSLGGVTKLNFHNCVTDASWMNEVLSHRLFRDAGVPAPRSAYARVYLTVPGLYNHEYVGLYSLVEDVDQEFAQEHFGTKKGAILKPVTPAPFADLGSDWKQYNQTYDPKTKLTPAQKQRIIDFCQLVSHASDDEFNAKLKQFVDLEETARFLAVEVWLATLDSILTIGQNYYVYLSSDDRLQFMPWDLDHSFGQFFMVGNQDQRENLSIRHPWRGENRFLERLFNNPEFNRAYMAAFQKFQQTIFKPERFAKQVDDIAAAIRPAVQDESSEKLERFDRVVQGEPVQPAGFGGGFRDGPPPGDEMRGRGGRRGFGPPGGMFQPAKPIKAFVTARAQSVDDQLAGRSQGETLEEFGFGGPPPGDGRGGRGGRGGLFGPGMFLAGGFLDALDANKDRTLTRDEFTKGFATWFKKWNSDKSGSLTEDQLRAGINEDLSPFRGGRPPGPPPE